MPGILGAFAHALTDVAVRARLAQLGLDHMNSDPALVRELDPSGIRRRVVLLGAGASAEAGLPAAPELLDLLEHDTRLTLFALCINAAGRDVERAVQLLELLAESNERGTLGSAVLRLGDFSKVPLPASHKRHHVHDLARYEMTIIMKVVRERYWLSDDDRDRVGYLKPLVAAQRGGTIATLNYDNAIELAGAAGSDFTVSELPVNVMQYDRAGMTRVIHLHGSLDWELRADRNRGINKVVGRAEWQDPSDLAYDYTPGIIFGAGNKLRSYGPYLRLYTMFQECLASARTLVTLGYGWADEHINDTVRSWATNPDRADSVEEAEGRRRLVVGIGPAASSLPAAAASLQLDHADLVEVIPLRGLASDVIREYFEPGGQLSPTLLEQYREAWCGS